MVAIAIVGILTAAAIVPLNKSRTKKEVEVAAREVAASIREAQNYALAGKNDSDGRYPCRIRWRTNDPTSYFIRFWRTNPATGSCGSQRDDKKINYSLQNGVEFRNIVNAITTFVTFDFTLPFGSYSSSALGSGLTQGTVTLKKGSYCVDVSVSSAGNITESPVVGC